MGPMGVPSLRMQAEKALHQPAYSHLISYCPTMDLIAVVNQAEQLDVYRLNGQRAFGLKQKSLSRRVDAICWKLNGTCIAVAWDDGSVDIVSSDTGKVIRHGITDSLGPAGEGPFSRISSLGWGINLIDVQAIKPKPSKQQQPLTTEAWESGKDEIMLDDFLDRQPEKNSQGINPDLPNQLALTDVESLLPKLPLIPPPPQTGPMAMMRTSRDSGPEVFTSQASVDAMLHSHHLKDPNSVDVLLRCYEGGTINPIIYDSLEIGRLQIPATWELPDVRPILHCSHPFSCSQNVLVEIPETKEFPPRLALLPLSLRFIPSAGLYLHLIASRTAQLQQLLRYVHQCLECIGAYWKQSQDLPSRWLANADDMLSEKSEGSIVQSLLNLAMTGSCSPTLKEWLVEDVGENNHKRWDNACNQGYTKIIELTHENLLPALDRCTLLICTLRGLAKYHNSSQVLDVPVKDFSDLLDTIRCLILLSHTLLSYAAEEKRQFAVFSAWLRFEMGNQRSDSNEEVSIDSEIGSAYPDLLAYLKGAMTDSRLKPYLTPPETTGDSVDEAILTYDNVCKAIAQQKGEEDYDSTVLHMITLSLCLQRLARQLFSKITAWQVSNSSMNCGLVLERSKCTCVDAKMAPAHDADDADADEEDMATYVAAVSAEMPGQLHLHRIRHAPVFADIDSSVRACEAVTVDFGQSTIRDVKMADENTLIAIIETTNESYILRLPYTNKRNDQGVHVPYSPLSSPQSTKPYEQLRLPHGTGDASRSVWDLSNQELARPFVQHVFHKNKLFVPLKLDVNGRKDRRALLVLAEDLKHYRIFDLDFPGEDPAADEDTLMAED